MTSPDYHTTWSGLQSDDPDAEIGLVGIPFDSATSYRKGASFAPSRIRAITPFIAPSTEEGRLISGLRVKDYGDIKGDLNWERYFGKVEAAAAQALTHPFALFIGGDHSVTIPLMRAFSASLAEGQKMGIVHFDSHLDLADVFEGHTWSHACTERRALELPNMEPRHLTFTGIRSWMGDELEVLAAHPEIGVHPAREVYTRGIEAVARDVVDQLQDCDAVYFTLDIDGLDPAYAPGTGTPEAGGLSTRECLEFARIIFTELPVRAMDIVEVSPPLDVADITSQAAIRVIYEVFGWVKGRKPKSHSDAVQDIDMRKYKRLQVQTQNPLTVGRAIVADGYNPITTIKLLRTLFDEVGLDQAKAIEQMASCEKKPRFIEKIDVYINQLLELEQESKDDAL